MNLALNLLFFFVIIRALKDFKDFQEPMETKAHGYDVVGVSSHCKNQRSLAVRLDESQAHFSKSDLKSEVGGPGNMK